MCVNVVLASFHRCLNAVVFRAMIGEIDAQKDAQLNYEEITAAPLKPVVH